MSTASDSPIVTHRAETAATASDLALGKLVLCGGAHALSPSNPDMSELREELLAYGRRAYGLANDPLRCSRRIASG